MVLVYQSSYKAAMLLLVALLFLQASGPALGSNGKTCYSRQHRDAIVNVRVAVERNRAVTSSRVKQAEKDCILACCSEEVEPGIKCNMVVYKPSSQPGMDNCYLFHCETEQDCPLVPAKPGINTYDISKDVIHPTAKGNGKTTVMPIIHATPAKQPITTQTTSMTMRPATTTTPRIMQPPTTTTQPTLTTSTTQPTTTTTTTTLPTTTTTKATTTSTTTTIRPPTEPAIVLVTMPVVTMPSTTATTTTTTKATTTTQLTSTTTKVPSTTSPTTTTTTTTQPPQPPQPPQQPQPPAKPIRPFKKTLKPPKRPEPQAGKSSKVPTTKPTTTTTTTTTQKPTTTPSTTTPTTSTTTTTTTTTTTPTTTTTATTSTTTTTTTTTTTSTATIGRTTIVVVEMENDLKDETSGPDTLMPPAMGSGLDKAKGSQMTWKNSLVAIVVVTLICLTLVLAVVGRKAMESFDRRHYTRLELNDLHYEI